MHLLLDLPWVFWLWLPLMEVPVPSLEQAAQGVLESASLEVLKDLWIWHMKTCFSEHGFGAGLIVGPDDLRVLFQL